MPTQWAAQFSIVHPVVIGFRRTMAAKQAECASRVLTLSCGMPTSNWLRAEPKPQVWIDDEKVIA
jgi:hypothetical protein